MNKALVRIKKLFSLVVVLGCIALCVWLFLWKKNIIPHKMYTNADFDIETYISQVDMDGDGIDDQTDILANVREYIATKPIYKSVYYAGGYPDDQYGVCTDVVAMGLMGAGYNLRELVDKDRRANPSEYADEPIDKNIDFRRVRNLLIYFKRHAICLTTDIYEIDQWQGGDIVVFEGHIGVVSDKRNKNGVSFVIHHGSRLQTSYEQDILESRGVIVGHFRIS